jgi:mRNA-degrading endonuclease toxin of MazEF toxin-antitoxin module
MMPKAGDVFMLDLGFQGKTRPVVIVSREDHNAPRALSVFVPLTKESLGGIRACLFKLSAEKPLTIRERVGNSQT